MLVIEGSSDDNSRYRETGCRKDRLEIMRGGEKRGMRQVRQMKRTSKVMTEMSNASEVQVLGMEQKRDVSDSTTMQALQCHGAREDSRRGRTWANVADGCPLCSLVWFRFS